MAKALIALIAAALMVLGMAAIASAHKAPSGMTYAPECCSGQDCRPIPESDVQLLPDSAYRIKATGEVFLPPGVNAVPPAKNYRWSNDQSFHRCNPTSGRTTYCLYVPQPGV